MQFHNPERSYKTWLEISKVAFFHNLRVFKDITGRRTKVLCVVKANAYGHGLKQAVSILSHKADWFGVDNIREALEIRSLGIDNPVLIMGYTPLGLIREVVGNEISFTVYDMQHLEKILSLDMNKKAKVHLKAETGLNRQGVDKKKLREFTKFITKNSSKIALEGLSTHFANIEDTLDPSFAVLQLKRFNSILEIVKENISPPIIHCAATAATLLYPNTHFDMVRTGIGLYGLWPSRETRVAFNLKKGRKKINLKPILSWKSIIAQIKEVKPGDSAGYGRTWLASKKSRIAIIPVGYSDGYDRKLSNNSRVLIKGKYVPIIGRIMMNMIVADVTEITNVKPEDVVTLLGEEKGESVTADELAFRLDTINYEVVSRISPLLPRIVV